jgi:Zn-dependent protease with chaperone function
MDFFEAQDRAKRNTGKLVMLYAMAVIGIILSVYIVTLILFHTQVSVEEDVSLWYPGWLITVAILVLLMIAIGTIHRVSQLRKGGSAVAELLGGRRVNPSTTDSLERRLINIVEEISIASGLPVPDVYILDQEENINAFAAGFGPNDAAVGVTRGCLEQLTRDELQGVIAHEFSHIFNGDMRLNIRLIGILNGILVIHIMGMILMRSAFYSGAMRSRSNNKGNSAIAIILFGLALIVIGYIGMIFGRMIQSAISRQREYLADAAAVQYTRNPDGIAGALSKIASKSKGAEIKDGHAMEMSHLFFASSFHSALDKLFATHPPIEDRIKAVAPHFGYGKSSRESRIRRQFHQQHVAGSAGDGSGSRGVGGHTALTPEVILAAIGTIGTGNLNRAGELLRDIPKNLRQAAHEPLSAEAMIYALLFSTGLAAEKKLPDWFYHEAGEEMGIATEKLLSELASSDRGWYLPLAELSLPSLRHMSKGQFKVFRNVLEKMIYEGNEDNLFGFALEKMVTHQLNTAFSEVRRPEIRHHHLKTLGKELSVLLSALAHASGTDTQQAWDVGVRSIERIKPDDLVLLPKEKCGLNELNHALDELAASANPVKKYILSAVIHCITSDKKITTEEKELTRAISEALGSPIPLGAMG